MYSVCKLKLGLRILQFFRFEFNINLHFQMTFETAVGFLRNATLGGKTDSLYSPSSCVVMGKPWIGGTASFRVVQNLMAAGGVKERKSSRGGAAMKLTQC